MSADLPEAFRELFAGLIEQRHFPGPGDAFHRCFGCGPAHTSGLHVRVFKTDAGVLAPVVEILGGAVVRATGKISVTGELTVRYVRPAPTETPLLGRGRLVADHGRYVDVEGSLEEFGAARVVATARGRFFPFATVGITPGSGTS